MVATQPVVNVYLQPSDQVEVTSQVIFGWEVQVLEDRGEWGRIAMHDGYAGWVRLAKLADDRCRAGEMLLRVENASANVYAEPDVKRRAALVQVPWEGRLWGVAQEGEWWRLRLPGSATAYVHTGDVTTGWNAVGVAEMIATGRRFLGVTYTWGGVSSIGYDCSGFVQMMMRQRGLNLPRDAQAQADWQGFLPIDITEAAAGDVLFFGAGEQEITHVGMSLGLGEFLHDTTEARPGVQVSRLQDRPWCDRVCAARRVRG